MLHNDGGNMCLRGSRSHAVARRWYSQSWKDHSVSFRIKILKLGSDYFSFSFKENIGSGYSRYFLNINDSGQPFKLFKQTTVDSTKEPLDKDFKPLSDTSRVLSKNRWYTLKINVEENRIKVFLDDQLLIDHSDHSDPIQSGQISFEIGKNAEVLIDDIVVTKDFLEETESTVTNDEKIYIPSLQATVHALRFYEDHEKGSPRASRRYSYDTSFNANDSRYIWWELYLTCQPGRRTSFDVYSELYDSDGVLLFERTIDGLYLDSNWSESIHAAGFGYPTTGLWKPGIYDLKLYIEGVQIAEKRFQVYSDILTAEKQDENTAGVYTIDNEFGTIPISELPIGAAITDSSWEWEFRTDSKYTGEGDKKVVRWILVAKNHYSNAEPHVTLLSEELIGLFPYDDSTDRGHNYGNNHWGQSGTGNAKHGLRPWLNSSGIHSGEGFYESFSNSFINQIVAIDIPNKEWEQDKLYSTNDKVFIPSTIELGFADNDDYARIFGIVYPYFDGVTAEERSALLAGEYKEYWTRSPLSFVSRSVRTVNSDGSLAMPNSYELFSIGYAYRSFCAVRPAVNIKADTLVYAVQE
jgi:hypothetical protein